VTVSLAWLLYVCPQELEYVAASATVPTPPVTPFVAVATTVAVAGVPGTMVTEPGLG